MYPSSSKKKDSKEIFFFKELKLTQIVGSRNHRDVRHMPIMTPQKNPSANELFSSFGGGGIYEKDLQVIFL